MTPRFKPPNEVLTNSYELINTFRWDFNGFLIRKQNQLKSNQVLRRIIDEQQKKAVPKLIPEKHPYCGGAIIVTDKQ